MVDWWITGLLVLPEIQRLRAGKFSPDAAGENGAAQFIGTDIRRETDQSAAGDIHGDVLVVDVVCGAGHLHLLVVNEDDPLKLRVRAIGGVCQSGVVIREG